MQGETRVLHQPLARDLARRLIASEVDANVTSEQTELATLRAYEKLRLQFCAPVGADGFQALASRALSLAKSQSPRLSTVRVAANGCLHGLGEVQLRMDPGEDGKVGVILIAQLLGLFLTLLGEVATVRLLEGVSRQTEIQVLRTGMSDFVSGTRCTDPFETILSEADRLRSVSESLEVLADNHAGIEELISVAGSIRNIASVLDVLTLIRSKAGDSQDDALDPPMNGYVN